MLDLESEHSLSSTVAVKSNFTSGWKPTICASGLGMSFSVVEFALQQPQHKSCRFIYLALFTGDVECSIRFHILPRSEATA